MQPLDISRQIQPLWRLPLRHRQEDRHGGPAPTGLRQADLSPVPASRIAAVTAFSPALISA